MEYSEHLYKSAVLTSDINLKCCGIRTDALNHRFGPAARENYFLILLKRGSGKLYVNKCEFELREGMIFVCFPNIATAYQADAGCVWDISWLSVDGESLAPLLELIGITPENPTAVPTGFKDLSEILARIYDLQGDTIKNSFKTQGLVYSFFASLLPEGIISDDEEDYISQAVRYMKHNIDKDISVKEIAAYVGLERVYFSKLFKKRTGLAPKDMLTKYRMEKALYFMETTNLSVCEIARSVGYTDSLYFSRAFKKHFGACPTKYTKK